MDIFLSVEPSRDQIAALFQSPLPLVIFDSWIETQFSPHTNIVISKRNSSEFPFGLGFVPQAEDHEHWLMATARKLSVSLNGRSLYSGSPLPNAKPYHSIVFDHGRAFLADDHDTVLANEGELAVKILGRVPELDWAQPSSDQ